MDKIKKNFGFGCMRFPMIGEEIDEAQVSQMVDYFLDQGFNYFDTAHGYIGERSELAVKNCLTSRYPRESYILTKKLLWKIRFLLLVCFMILENIVLSFRGLFMKNGDGQKRG